MRRYAAAALLALTLAGCGGKAAEQGPQAARVQVETVSLTRTQAQERYSASVEPNVRVQLAFNAGGYVTSLKTVGSRPVQAGDPVRRGEALVHLRQSDFQSRRDAATAQVERARAGAAGSASQVSEAEGAHEQAGAAVTEAEAAVEQAEGALREAGAARAQAAATVREADSALRQAQADYDRARALADAQAMTLADYDAARARYEIARAKLDEAREGVRQLDARQAQARAQVTAARSRVAQARGQERAAAARVDGARAAYTAGEADVSGAEAALVQADLAVEDSVLRSPLDGVVLSRQVEVGSLVAPGAPGLVVADLRTVKVVFGVPDVVMQGIRLGQRVYIKAESVPGQSFPGKVTALSPAADPQSRVFTVEVSVPNPKGDLKAGMVVALDLSEGKAPVGDVLTVPVSAIQKEESGGLYVVYVLDGTKARRREVRLGEAVGNRVVVTEGLADGDRVVVDGANLLHDGDTVQVTGS